MTDANKSLMERVHDGLSTYQDAFDRAIPATLGDNLTGKRICQLAAAAVAENPYVLDVATRSQDGMRTFLRSAMTCARLGLEPGAALGLAYFVPYGSDIQLTIGYPGYIDLATRDGRIVIMESALVYQREVDEGRFKHLRGTERKLYHDPIDSVPENWEDLSFYTEKPTLDQWRGPIHGAYAVAVFENGAVQFLFMPIEDIEKIGQGVVARMGAGKTNWGKPKDSNEYRGMVLKTPIRHLAKQLPKGTRSRELVHAARLDDAYESGVKQTLDALPDDDGGFSVPEGEGLTEKAIATLRSYRRQCITASYYDEEGIDRIIEDATQGRITEWPRTKEDAVPVLKTLTRDEADPIFDVLETALGIKRD